MCSALSKVGLGTFCVNLIDLSRIIETLEYIIEMMMRENVI